MRYVKAIVLFLVSILLILNIVFNLFLLLNNRNIKRNFKNLGFDIEYKYLFYFFPNILLAKNFHIKTSSINLSFNSTTCYINIFNSIRYKNFYIYSIRVNNFLLQIIDNPTTKNSLLLIDKEKVYKNINFIPHRIYFYNGKIEYKNLFEIKNISLRSIRNNQKIDLSFSGEEKNYKIKLTFDADIVKDMWVLDTKMVANNEIALSILPEIKLEIFGNFNFEEVKNYNILLKTFKNKEIRLTGNINFYPFKLETNIMGDVLNGVSFIDKTNGQFKGEWSGELYIDNFFKSVVERKDYFKIYTEGNFLFSNNEYLFITKLYNKNIKTEFFIKNSKGYIKISPKGYGILKHDIFSEVEYNKDSKVLDIISKDTILPFNLCLALNQITNFKINGDFLGNEVLGYFLKNKEKTEISLDFKNKLQYLNFKFLTDSSTSYAKINFYNKNKKTHIYGEMSSVDNNKRINFNIEFKNLLINRRKISFMSYGYMNRTKDLENLLACIFFQDLFYEDQKVLNLISSKIYLENNSVNINFEDINKVLLGNLRYNLENKTYNGKIKFEKPKLKIDKFLADVLLDIQFYKDEKFKLFGRYKINNIFYDKKNLLILTEGNFNSTDINKINLEGELINNSKKIFSYKSIIDIRKNIFDIYFYSLKLFNKELFNLELNLSSLLFQIDQNNKQKKLGFSGRIYNEDSEILILPSYFLSNFDYLKLNLKIKNLTFGKNNFSGELIFDIKNIGKDVINISLKMNNLWINDYFLDRSDIKTILNKKEKKLNFILDKSVDKENASILKVIGEIWFFYNYIKFKNFKIYNSDQQYLFLNGNLGNDGDVLQIKFFGVPFEILKSILGIGKAEILGIAYGDVIIETISSKKNYKIRINSTIKEVTFEQLKILQILSKISIEDNKVFLENFVLDFNQGRKIEVKGIYNINSKNCDFFVKSINCDASIFNDFYDIIKSAEGSFIMELNLKGKIYTPQIKGYFYLPKGNFKFKKYINSLNNVVIKLNFLSDKIEVEKFYGYYKNTKLTVFGMWSFFNDSRLKIYTQGGKGISVSVPELSFPTGEFFKFVKDTSLSSSSGEIELDLNLTKQKNSLPLIEGKIILNNTHFTYPGVEKQTVINTDNKFFYDITIIAKDNVWYENEFISANITGSVNLNYTKPNMKTDINGEATSLGGNMKFLNTNFRIKSGRIQLIKRIPYLELIGETDIVSYGREKIKVQLVIDRTPIEEIKPKLVSSSHPTLKSEEITSILLGIGKLQKTEKEDYVVAKEQIDYTSLLRSQFVRLIDSTLATPIAKNILQKWGIVDNITISQLPSSIAEEKQTTSNNSTLQDRISFLDIVKNTKYGIEKYITSDMIIGYSIALAEYQQKLNLRHEIEVGYRLKGNVFIKGIYDYGIRDYSTGRYGGDVKVQIEPVFKLKSWAEEEQQEQQK